MLQGDAVCCSVLQYVTVFCVAVCCSVVSPVYVHLAPKHRALCRLVCCIVLQCVAVCCSVLQCVAVCCSVVQSVAEWRHQAMYVLHSGIAQVVM